VKHHRVSDQTSMMECALPRMRAKWLSEAIVRYTGMTKFDSQRIISHKWKNSWGLNCFYHALWVGLVREAGAKPAAASLLRSLAGLFFVVRQPHYHV